MHEQLVLVCLKAAFLWVNTPRDGNIMAEQLDHEFEELMVSLQ